MRADTTARLFATTTKNAVVAGDLVLLEMAVQEVLVNPCLQYARVRGRCGIVLAEGSRTCPPPRVSLTVHEFGDTDGILDVFEYPVAGRTYGRVEIGLTIGDLDTLPPRQPRDSRSA
jgi:hypothetical protein